MTVLFADLVESTARADGRDPEDVRATLTPFYERMRAVLVRFGGQVEKFIGDAVMALFGAPAAHEDDPERGVRAALAIQEAIEQLNAQLGLELNLRISVATGEAVIDLRARAEDGQVVATGDIMNIGFRLAEAAPVNGVLVDESTYRATHHNIEFSPAGLVQAKGKAAPLLTWQAVAPRIRVGENGPRRRPVPLVGRQAELSLLVDIFERARREPASQLVTVVGVPGIGKSRLIGEFADLVGARDDGICWRQGRSLPYGEEAPFWALREILKTHADIRRSDDPGTTEGKLRQAARHAMPEATETEWLVRQLRPLVGLPDEAHANGARRSGEFAAWRRFFEGIAGSQPLVVVFEDIHWADEGLLEFIDHLATHSARVPLMILCTARPSLFERHSGWGAKGQPNATRIALEPLSDTDTAALVGLLLEDVTLPDGLTRELLTRTAGNPLYAREYVRMLVDRGLVRPAGNGLRLDGSDALPLPESIQGIIAARLDSLPAEEKILLQSAAVVGRRFWVGALAMLCDLPHYVVSERLAALERKQFVREDCQGPASSTRYVFQHALIRDVAYGQIPRASRADKHRLTAEWLETLTSDRADLAELVSYHYQRALEFARAAGQEVGDLAVRARRAIRHAGDRAAAFNSWAVAKRLYGEALGLGPSDPERIHLLFRYGKAWFRADGGGAETLEDARDELIRQGDNELAAEAEVMLGDLQFRRGKHDLAFTRFEHAVALLAEAPPSPSKAHVLSVLSRFHSASLNVSTAISIGRQALAMAEDLGLDEVRAHALNNIGTARAALADAGGIQDIERGLAIALTRNSPESIRAYNNLGTCLAHFGDLRGSFEMHAKGRRAAERLGDSCGMQWFAAERAWELYWTGQWDEATAAAQALLAEAELGSARSHSEPAALPVQSWIALARGNLDGALEAATRLRDFAKEANYLQSLFPAVALCARALAAAGRHKEAWDDIAELLQLWRQSEFDIGPFWTADLAFAVSQLGNDEAVLAALRCAPATLWVEAARAIVTEDFEEAVALYGRIGSAPDEALARLHAGRRLLHSDRKSEAAAQLDRAVEFHRRVRAQRYVQEGEALRSAIR